AARHDYRIPDDRCELHALQHVASQVDAWRVFNELDVLRRKGKHGAFRDVAHALAALDSLCTAELDASDFFDELGDLTVSFDRKLVVLDLHPGSLHIEAPAKDDVLRTLRDIDETSRPADLAAKMRNVDMARFVHFRHA